MKLVSTQIVNGSVKIRYVKISAQRVSYSFGKLMNQTMWKPLIIV